MPPGPTSACTVGKKVPVNPDFWRSKGVDPPTMRPHVTQPGGQNCYTWGAVLRRFTQLLVALFAIAAVGQANAATVVCRAEAEARACHCDHKAMAAAPDACCTGQGVGVASAAPFALLAPPDRLEFSASYAYPSAKPTIAVVGMLPAGNAHDAPARAPPVPRFLRLRTLLI